ncbi:MAG TPA: N-acetyl-gamma-glutamyl-phosphate reductase [Tepidisphaeraceae bacterium]
MSIRVGIVGIAGYGGGEALRYLTQHPQFKLVYAAGESTAGTRLGDRYPGVPSELADLVIQSFDSSKLPDVQLLFASLPTGASQSLLAHVPANVKIVDIGGDHRYVDGWTYGLADVWPEQIVGKTRIANPGCYPAATLTPLAPLLANKMIEPGNIIIDAKTGVSGAGRGGGDSKFGYAECNEDLAVYGLLKHTHMPEISTTIANLSGGSAKGLVFTPHLIPMTRGIMATIYARGSATTAECLDAARTFYRERPFVRVVDKTLHTKWAAGTNLAFVSYAADPERNLVMAMCVIDNLGKGAAGQAIQNANLMCGLDAETGFSGSSIWP